MSIFIRVLIAPPSLDRVGVLLAVVDATASAEQAMAGICASISAPSKGDVPTYRLRQRASSLNSTSSTRVFSTPNTARHKQAFCTTFSVFQL